MASLHFPLRAPLRFLLAILSCALGSPPFTAARAQEKVWIGGATGDWSMGANWLDGAPPPAAGSATLALRFATAPISFPISRHDLDSGFLVNQLIFDQSPGSALTLSSLFPRTLTLGGAGSGIRQDGTGSVTITAPLVLDPSDDVVTLSGNGVGRITISALTSLAAGKTLRIATGGPAGTGSLTHLTGAAGVTGVVELVSGNLGVSSLGTATLRISGGTLIMGSSLGNNISLASDLVVSSLATTFSPSLSGVISSAVPGTGLQLRFLSGTLRLTAPATYTGATVIDYGFTSTAPAQSAATLSLTGAGSILNSSLIDVRSGGILQLAAGANRIGDSTPVILRSGSLLVTPSAAFTETIGPVSFAGFSLFGFVPSLTGSETILSADSVDRIQRGTVNFRSVFLNRIGPRPQRILFTSPPTLSGGGVGPDTGIIPFAIGDISASPIPTGGLVTYDPAFGVRLLDPGTEYAPTLAGAAPTNNVRLTSGETIAGNATVNALLAVNSAAIDGAGSLSVTSGTVLSLRGLEVNVPLHFGAAEGQLFATDQITIRGGITGSNGITKSGEGPLILQSDSTFTGPLTINAGRVEFSALAHLGADSGPIVSNGGELRYRGTSPLDFTRPIEVGSGFLTLNSPLAMLSIEAPVSGAGGIVLGAPSGPGLFRLNTDNSHAGPTVLVGGVTEIVGDGVFGGGAVWIGSTLRLLGPWTTSREIRVIGNGIVDANGFDARWDGNLTSTGISSLQKLGEGTLALSAPSSFDRDVFIRGGTLALTDAGQVQSTEIQVFSPGEFRLEKDAGNPQRLAAAATVILSGGKLSLAGSGPGVAREVISRLEIASGSSTGSVLQFESQAGAGVTLQASAFIRSGPELLIVSDALGGPGGSGFGRLVLANPPPAIDGLATGIYAATAIGGGAETFTTYNAASDSACVIGVQPLPATSYTPVGALLQNPGTPAGAHALLQGATSGGGTGNSVRSLTFDPGASLSQSASQTLAISSGQVLIRSKQTAAITGGTLDFGANPGVIATFGNLTLDATVSGAGGYLKSGPGILTLGSQTAGSASGLTVAGGTLRLSTPAALANSQRLTLITGATFDLEGKDVTVGGLAGAGIVNLEGATLTLGSAGQDFTFVGDIRGAGTISVLDGGNPDALRTLTLSGDSDGAGITLLSGRLNYLRAPGALRPLPLTLEGGVLEVSGAFSIPLHLAGDALIRGNAAFGSPAAIDGAGPFHLDRSSMVTLSIPAEHTGETIVERNALLTLPGGSQLFLPRGELRATSAIRIRGGELRISYDSSTNERLNDAAPIYLAGRLSASAPSAGTAVEHTGPVVVQSGGKIVLSPYFISGSVSAVDLRIPEIVRADGGTLEIEAKNLGDLTDPASPLIHIATPPVTIGGGASSGPGISIVPWMFSRLDSGDVTFLAVNAAQGLHPLDVTDDYAQGLGDAAAAGGNVRSFGAQTLDAPLSINSLLLTGQAGQPSITGPGVLTIASGAILSSAFSGSTIAVPLDFAGGEALVIAQLGAITISGAIQGAASLTKAGSQTLTLSGDSAIDGPIRVLQGVLSFAKPESLGSSAAPIILDGGTLQRGETAAGTFARPIVLAERGGTISNGSNGTLTLASQITGAGDVTFSGSLLVTGANTYTGNTTVSSFLSFTSEAALGAGGAIFFSAGTLEPTFDWTTSRAIYPSDNARVSSGPFDVIWNGPVLGRGALFKEGEGSLTLRDASAFGGDVFVRDGTLIIDGDITGVNPAIEGDLVFVATGATLVGNGVWARDLQNFGVLAPGPGIGELTVNDLTLARPSPVATEPRLLALEIASATSFDRISVRGAVMLDGLVNLTLDLAYDPEDFIDTFRILDNDGADPIAGAAPHHFSFGGAELGEGAEFLAGSQFFRISYAGGDGNDVVLSAIPEPSAPALLLVAASSAALRHRRQRGSHK